MRGSAAVCLVLVLVPRVLAAQASESEQASPVPDDNWSRRLSVHVAVGATLQQGDDNGGNVQFLSMGFSPTSKLTVLVSGGRTHSPTRVDDFSGGSSAFRGGTAQFVSGELRFAPRSF